MNPSNRKLLVRYSSMYHLRLERRKQSTSHLEKSEILNPITDVHPKRGREGKEAERDRERWRERERERERER